MSGGPHSKRNDFPFFDVVTRQPRGVHTIKTDTALSPQYVKRCALFGFCDQAFEYRNHNLAQVQVLTKQCAQLPKRRTKSIVAIAVADQITEAFERHIEPQDGRFGQTSPVSKLLERKRGRAITKGIQHRQSTLDRVYTGKAIVKAAFAAVRLCLFGSSFGHFTPFGQPERILALNGCGAISRCGKYANPHLDFAGSNSSLSGPHTSPQYVLCRSRSNARRKKVTHAV